MPLGKDVSQNIRELNDKHPEWSRDRKVAAAINAARAHGAIYPRKRRTVVKKKSSRSKRYKG